MINALQHEQREFDLQKEINDLKAENNNLKEYIKYLENDLDGWRGQVSEMNSDFREHMRNQP